jgi:hypothetical protein
MDKMSNVFSCFKFLNFFVKRGSIKASHGCAHPFFFFIDVFVVTYETILGFLDHVV